LVTAAHCLVQPDSSVGSIKAIPRAPITAMTVGVGSVQNSTKYPIAVKRTLVSPIYNPVNNTNDIALIELDTVLTFNSTVQPIHISKSRISSGQEVTALGWGYTQNKTMSNTLLSVDLETAPDSKCYAGYPEWKGQNADLVCTGNTPGKDTCYGDSGGPL
ncbi:trypsin-like protease, partial [Syncephalis fuscata]